MGGETCEVWTPWLNDDLDFSPLRFFSGKLRYTNETCSGSAAQVRARKFEALESRRVYRTNFTLLVLGLRRVKGRERV